MPKDPMEFQFLTFLGLKLQDFFCFLPIKHIIHSLKEFSKGGFSKIYSPFTKIEK